MEQERKPLKRNEHLMKLSHEHHEGLVFANRLKKGADCGTATSILHDYVLGFWSFCLEAHFISEEKYLLPFLAKTNSFTQRFIHEHIMIRELIRRIRQSPAEMENFSKLAMALTEHIRFEERQFFPLIETQLTPEQLKKAGNSMKGAPSCYIFQHEFWKK